MSDTDSPSSPDVKTMKSFEIGPCFWCGELTGRQLLMLEPYGSTEVAFAHKECWSKEHHYRNFYGCNGFATILKRHEVAKVVLSRAHLLGEDGGTVLIAEDLLWEKDPEWE